MEIEREALVLAERQRADTQGLIDTGSRAPADGLSFETRVATREESVLSAELQERQRAIALSQLLGRPPASGLSIETMAPAFGQVGALDAVSGHIGLTLELPMDGAARRGLVCGGLDRES